MANSPKKGAKRRKFAKPKLEKIETDPGAWDRFKHAVDAAVKSGPKHRTPPKPHKPVKKMKTNSRQNKKAGGNRRQVKKR